jgi:L-iditol 2-dehydrogenase
MYYSNKDIRLETMPTPSIGPGELLVRIHASGICGSDVMEWYRIQKAPLVLGHEIAGEVIDVGEGVMAFKRGDRVAATHHVPCFTCQYCLSGHETVCDLLLSGTHFEPGGFCEYVRLPAINVERGTWIIPEELNYDEATFVEPLACVLRGQRTMRLRPAQRLLVLGSGISGLLFITVARAVGAGQIVATDVSEYRLHAARGLGADYTIRADQDVPGLFREINDGRGADAVVVAAGSERAIEQAFQAVERGGVILLFAPAPDGAAISLPINKLFWRRDVTVTTTYGGGPADCARGLELMRTKRVQVRDMVTHRFGLADTIEGFRLVERGNESIKVIIRPQE